MIGKRAHSPNTTRVAQTSRLALFLQRIKSAKPNSTRPPNKNFTIGICSPPDLINMNHRTEVESAELSPAQSGAAVL